MKKTYMQMNMNTVVLFVVIVVGYFFISRFVMNQNHYTLKNTEPFTTGINSFINKNKRNMKNRFNNAYHYIKGKIPRFR